MWIFLAVKIENFVGIHFDTFNNFVQNIDCGYTLEPPRRGGSNEYPKYMFVSKIRKKNNTVLLCKSGYNGVYIIWPCYPDVLQHITVQVR